MWPWEHVLVAYVVLSTVQHGRGQGPPGDWPVVALTVGSLFPDVVDKPLAWQFGLFESGWNVAHSVFVAVPVVVLVYAVARRRGAAGWGGAFGVGYLLHLPGDVGPASVSRGRLYLDPIIWPFGNPDRLDSAPASFLDAVGDLLVLYAEALLASPPTPELLLRLTLVVLGIVLWVHDGRPGVRPVVVWVRRVVAGGRGD